MNHFHVTGGLEVAKAISAAIWRVCVPRRAAADSASIYAIAWRVTQGGALLDFPDDYEVKLLNLAAAAEVLNLIAPAAPEAEANALAADLIRYAGQSVPLLDLLPASIRVGLIATDDLEAAGCAPIPPPGPGQVDMLAQ